MKDLPVPKFTAIMTVITLLSLACTTAGDSSSESGFWTYEVTTTISEIPVTGTITYRMAGSSTTLVDGDVVDVDVLKVTGYFEGNVSVNDLRRSVTGVFDGFRHEIRDSPAIVMDDLASIALISEGYDAIQESSSVTVQEVLSYSPPLMYGIDVRTMVVGDSWNESTEVTRLLSVSDGIDIDDSDDVSTESICYSVVSSGTESTKAGDFSATQMMQAWGDLNESYWFAEEAGRFVRYERTEPGLNEPIYVAVLADYSWDGNSEDTNLETLLTGLLLVSSAFLAVVIVMAVARRRPSRVRTMEGASETATAAKAKDEGDDVVTGKED